MGKRKSKARVMKKAKAAVDTIFDCPYCNHKQTVEVKMNYDNKLGNLKCRVCGITFQAPIHHLSDPIDVFSEWIDAAEALNADLTKPSKSSSTHKIKHEQKRERLEEDEEEPEDVGAGRDE